MPELPEVETIVRQLKHGHQGAPPVLGRVIRDVEIHWARHIAEPEPELFQKKVSGNRILNLHRRAKYLVFSLERGTMLIHLKMTGDLTVHPDEEPLGKYDHTVFRFDNGWQLRFSDARKFGKIYWLQDPESLLGKLGPEPLEAEFTPGVLREQLEGRYRAIKPLLLEQSFVAGLGNIYADESLHKAGLHPLRPADQLDEQDIKALWKSIRSSLKQGIARHGTSLDWVYRGGNNQNYLRVYGREGEPCPDCGTTIERIVISQRGTHFCPQCQMEGEYS